MNGDIKIGKLLCDEDIITKRQLNQALQLQVKGDKRTLGEILVDKDFCSLNDITEVMMRTGDEHDHDDMYDVDSALGSAGMWTDEYFDPCGEDFGFFGEMGMHEDQLYKSLQAIGLRPLRAAAKKYNYTLCKPQQNNVG